MRKTAFILSLMFLLTLGLAPAYAQTADDGTYATQTEDDGPDLGWIGLLGLAGLLGLRKREPVYRDTTRTATNPTTGR
ncbi:MAG TPA: WGxxGxxG family protein [Thermoanaerobaculia bacterium]|nr:WGxxGxxG family protein [Thermoanaerobaculia bacterium]